MFWQVQIPRKPVMPFLLEAKTVANSPGSQKLKCEKCIPQTDLIRCEDRIFQDLGPQTQTDVSSLLEI